MLKLLGSIAADRFGYVSPNNGPGPAERRITYSLIRKQNISWDIMSQLIFPVAICALAGIHASVPNVQVLEDEQNKTLS